MHYYFRDIKKFNYLTRHLTRVERSLHTDLTELYLETEQPLTSDKKRLQRLVSANTEVEKEALEFVLSEFFELTGEVYSNNFCDETIEEYQSKTSKKSKAGKASAAARKKKAEERKRKRSTTNKQKSTSDEQVLNGCATNNKSIINNHKSFSKAFAFEGKYRIRLTREHFDDIEKQYPDIPDLVKELGQLDLELKDATDKSWFMAMNAKLNYRNKRAKENASRIQYYRKPEKQTPSERAIEQGRIAIAMAEQAEQQEREASYCSVDKDDPVVSIQVGEKRRKNT